jgi:hypothetical protein
MADVQLTTLQGCSRAVSGAASLAGAGDVEGAELALERAQYRLRVLLRDLPPHSRRARLARDAVKKGRQAVEGARKGAGIIELGRWVGAAERAAERALEP